MAMFGVYQQSQYVQRRAREADAQFERLLTSPNLNEAERDLVTTLRVVTAEAHDDIRGALDEKGRLVRHAQVLKVDRGRLLDDKPVVDVHLQGGETVGLAVDPDVAERLRVGYMLDLSQDHKEVLDIRPRPLFYSVGTVLGIHRDDGGPTVEVGSERSQTRDVLVPADGFPLGDVREGRLVRYYGRCVYELREAPGSAFLEGRRRSGDFDVRRGEVVGADQQSLITSLNTFLDKHTTPARYPHRRGGGRHRILIWGPPGIGKSESIRAFITEARERVPGLHCFTLGANEFRSSLVGGTSERIRETFANVNRLAADGALVVLVIEEGTGLLLDRTRSSHYLDAGTSLRATEDFLSELDSTKGGLHENVILIMTSNRTDLMDSAAYGRFVQRPVRTFGAAEFQAVLRNRIEQHAPEYFGAWEPAYREAVEDALEVAIGRVLVGNETRDVRVRHVVNGRMADWSYRQACDRVDEAIFLSGGRERSPLPDVTPALLATMIVEQAVAEFTPLSLDECRRRLTGSDICREGKAESIQRPEAFVLDAVPLPEELDARPLLRELASRSRSGGASPAA